MDIKRHDNLFHLIGPMVDQNGNISGRIAPIIEEKHFNEVD